MRKMYRNSSRVFGFSILTSVQFREFLLDWSSNEFSDGTRRLDAAKEIPQQQQFLEDDNRPNEWSRAEHHHCEREPVHSIFLLGRIKTCVGLN